MKHLTKIEKEKKDGAYRKDIIEGYYSGTVIRSISKLVSYNEHFGQWFFNTKKANINVKRKCNKYICAIILQGVFGSSFISSQSNGNPNYIYKSFGSCHFVFRVV